MCKFADPDFVFELGANISKVGLKVSLDHTNKIHNVSRKTVHFFPKCS